MKVTGRELSIGILVLAFIGGAYVLSQYTGERGQMIRIGYSFFAEEGRRVGRVLSVKQEEVTPNFVYNYSLKFERPDLVGDMLCWLVRFEQWGRPGHYMRARAPRAVKGIGITYATTPMGADHTAGYTISPEILGIGGDVEALNADKIELARNYQEEAGFIDTSGYCLFITFAVLDNAEGLEGVVESCNAILGTSWTTDDIRRIGREVLKLELGFNAKAGFTKAHDRLPEFMSYEKLPPHNNVFDVTDEDLDKVHPK